ncbi:2-oxoacid:ferredoxin oxidoreductase subunit beta [candidate division KSB1 bacterium]|nr:2-oxoacid:ferredoxin oxidoreductase subunit beta [candidate division KSB1 bacterium]
MSTKEKTISPNGPTSLKLTKKDFESDQEVRWCPGCGDYSILAQTQRTLPDLNIPKEKYVFISGIGCSSRFPYYMNTYGFHTIHGRAPAIATGIKATNPDLSVWVITGDGDGLSIGGNHLIHLLRRNVDLNVILFNNRIYGLTKGQYSPTSEFGKVTKSTPFGSVDHPFNPISLAIGAGATFVARTLDRDPSHMQETMKRAAQHKGTSFIEVFQNCNIFNDGTWFKYTEKDSKPDHVIYLEQDKPLVFGAQSDKGIRLNGFKPEVVSLGNGKYTEDDLVVHNEKDRDMTYAFVLSHMMDNPEMPAPIGVFRSVESPCYEDEMNRQIEWTKEKFGKPDLRQLLEAGDTWEVE